MLDQSSSVDVHGCIVVEINRDAGEFLREHSGTRNVGVNEKVEFERAMLWVELKGCSEERLGDGEGIELRHYERYFVVVVRLIRWYFGGGRGYYSRFIVVIQSTYME